MSYAIPICRTALLLCLCAAPTWCCGQQAGPLGLNDIVNRMHVAEQESRAASYLVVREYRLSSPGSNSDASTVKVQVQYLAPFTKQFAIRETQGSDRGEKIVRRVLEHESQMAARPQSWDLTPENYSFTLLGSDILGGRRCYVLGLKPKRDTTELIRGNTWIDADTFLVLRVEGEPAKSPSWWVKNIHLVIEYGAANGLWLTMQTRATAELRLFGKHTLTSQSVEVRALTETASVRRSRPSTAQPKSPHPIAPAGAWISH